MKKNKWDSDKSDTEVENVILTGIFHEMKDLRNEMKR